MIKVFEKEEVFDIIYDCLIINSTIHIVCDKLKEYGYVDDQETSKESLRVLLNSEYIEKYKLTENEVTELKYMKQLGYSKIYRKPSKWSTETIEKTRLSNERHMLLKNSYQGLDNIDRTKTYSIEELLKNNEVVE